MSKAATTKRKKKDEAVTSKPRLSTMKTIQAIAIKPPQVPEAGPSGEIEFIMNYVDSVGKPKKINCTKTVYQHIKNQNLFREHRHNFRLRCADGKTVSSIDKYPKPELNNVFKADGDEADARFVVMQRHDDDSFTTKSQPEAVAQTVVDDISDLLHQNPKVSDGDLLGGKYLVDGVSKRGGAEILYIVPEPK